MSSVFSLLALHSVPGHLIHSLCFFLPPMPLIPKYFLSGSYFYGLLKFATSGTELISFPSLPSHSASSFTFCIFFNPPSKLQSPESSLTVPSPSPCPPVTALSVLTPRLCTLQLHLLTLPVSDSVLLLQHMPWLRAQFPGVPVVRVITVPVPS